jgi:hypothetical protein
MVAPLGMLSVDPAAATTEVEEGIDGRPLLVLTVGPTVATTKVLEDVNGGCRGGCCQQVL